MGTGIRSGAKEWQQMPAGKKGKTTEERATATEERIIAAEERTTAIEERAMGTEERATALLVPWLEPQSSRR